MIIVLGVEEADRDHHRILHALGTEVSQTTNSPLLQIRLPSTWNPKNPKKRSLLGKSCLKETFC